MRVGDKVRLKYSEPDAPLGTVTWASDVPGGDVKVVWPDGDFDIHLADNFVLVAEGDTDGD